MILYDNTARTLTLHTRRTTYQMKADEYGVLLHTWYGPRVEGQDLSYLIQYADRGFSPNPHGAAPRRDYSLDTLLQEYSTCGVGDFRLPSAEAEQPDGSLLLDWRYAGHAVREGKYTLDGLPAFEGGAGWQTLSVFLKDPCSGMRAELLYGVCEEYDLITRAAVLKNEGDAPVRLRRAMSFCLDLPSAGLELVTFDGGHVKERSLHRAALRPGVQGVGSLRGISSHQHNPFVMLCEPGADEQHGLTYGAALVYSGNFAAEAERSQFETARLVMGIHPHHFCWTLAPGGSFTTPEAALVCSPDGFAGMSRCYHRAMRQYLIHDPLRGGRRPVLVNNWEATGFDFTAGRLVEIAKEGAELGADLFVMDDGWFGERNDDNAGLGDWTVNEQKLEGGLPQLVERIAQLGMRFGIWIEPEMVNEDSDLYRAHPDWAFGAPGRLQTRSRNQLVLDFSRKEVRDYIYSALRRVLDSAPISYVKWDINRSLSDVWSAALAPERQGEVYHRYVLGVYDILGRMRRDYPQILIEGCAGGGGRFDAGMLYYTPQIWTSDNTDAIDRLRIQYGSSFCYPVSAMGSHVSAVPNGQTGRVTPIHTRGVVAMSGTFGYEMDLGHCTDEEKETVKEQIAFFRAHYRLIQEGDYARLSSPDDPFTAWQQTAPDGREALVSVVTGSARAAQPFRAVRLRDLVPDALYRVNEGDALYTGAALMAAGLPLPLPAGDYEAYRFHLRTEPEEG